MGKRSKKVKIKEKTKQTKNVIPPKSVRLQLMRKHFLEFYNAGYTSNSIAIMFNVSYNTVNEERKKYFPYEEDSCTPQVEVSVIETETEEIVDNSVFENISDKSLSSEGEFVLFDSEISNTEHKEPKEISNAEHEENEVLLNSFVEILAQMEHTLTELLEEEKRYA